MPEPDDSSEASVLENGFAGATEVKAGFSRWPEFRLVLRRSSLSTFPASSFASAACWNGSLGACPPACMASWDGFGGGEPECEACLIRSIRGSRISGRAAGGDCGGELVSKDLVTRGDEYGEPAKGCQSSRRSERDTDSSYQCRRVVLAEKSLSAAAAVKRALVAAGSDGKDSRT